MTRHALKPTHGMDRVATLDEIQTALALFDDHNPSEDIVDSLEIPSDRGGYIRISAEEIEWISLIEEVTQAVK